jgi:hypothetical protein
MQRVDEFSRMLVAVSVAIDVHNLHTAFLCKLQRRIECLLCFTPDNPYGVEAEGFTGSGSCIDMV